MAKQKTVKRASHKIIITDEMIDSAIPQNSQNRVWADGCHEAGWFRPDVDTHTIRVTDPVTKDRLTFLTPAVVQAEIINFDIGVRPRPVEFTLKQPIHRRRSVHEPGKKGVPIVKFGVDNGKRSDGVHGGFISSAGVTKESGSAPKRMAKKINRHYGEKNLVWARDYQEGQRVVAE